MRRLQTLDDHQFIGAFFSLDDHKMRENDIREVAFTTVGQFNLPMILIP
jgi:hypothetical protein